MQFQTVKGMRDFYPEAMRVRNWLVDAWRRVSLRNGFEEYDAPILEYLDLFTVKSGQEIVEQLYSLTDRGGRSLAIRPEITPSLARMVNARINALPRPIKWFSIPRLCRAERPQQGRLREFFQWNVDVIDSDSILADAECIFVAVDFFREVGLSSDDVCVRIGSRPLTMALLRHLGVGEGRQEKALAVLDKRPKVSDEDFRAMCLELQLGPADVEQICRFQDCPEVAALRTQPFMAEGGESAAADLAALAELEAHLTAMGAWDYCRLDMRIVRGLAYYTGVVYEIFDTAQSLRAVAGGGRYDNLLEVLGGPKVTGTGFGMGDVVLGLLLEEKGKLPAIPELLEFFVIDGEESDFANVVAAVGALRRAGLSADFSYKRQSIGKQLKAANRRGARRAAIVRGDSVAVKDLATGEQVDRPLEEFRRRPMDAAPQRP